MRQSFGIGHNSQLHSRHLVVCVALAIACCFFPSKVNAENYTFTTFASRPVPGDDDGSGSSARFTYPSAIAVDGTGNIYVGDNFTVRKVTPSGVVSTLAGVAGVYGSTDGRGGGALLEGAYGLALDVSGNVYVSGGTTIRKITPTGMVSTLAGMAGVSGSADGFGTSAQFGSASGLAVDLSGNIYVGDNSRIRKISPSGLVSTFATGFYLVNGVAVDGSGNVYVADTFNSVIQKVTPLGTVSIVAGSFQNPGNLDGPVGMALFFEPTSVCVDSASNLFVTDNNSIRLITPGGTVITLAGKAGIAGSADGTATAARFNNPSGVTVGGSGKIYIADTFNHSVRSLFANNVSTLAGSVGSIDQTGAPVAFNNPDGLAIDRNGYLYVADRGNNTIRKITPSGVVSTLAGITGVAGFADNANGTGATFNTPVAVALDRNANIYVADSNNGSIRKITPGGAVSTLATGFSSPVGVGVDNNDNVYVADYVDAKIYKVTPAGSVSRYAGYGNSGGIPIGGGPPPPSGPFSGPNGLVVNGNSSPIIYVSDDDLIYKVTSQDTVAILAGTDFGSADGIGTAAQFEGPAGLAIGGNDLYVADSGNGNIRHITSGGLVTTIGGKAGIYGFVDGTGSSARFNNPLGMASYGSTIYVVDSRNNAVRMGVPALSDFATIDATTGTIGTLRQLGTSFPATAGTWNWSIIRRPANSTAALSSSSAQSPTFRPDVADTFVFRLTATSTYGSSISTVSLTGTLDPSSTSAANVSTSYNTAMQAVPLSASVSSGFGTVNEGSVTFQLTRGGANVGSPATGSVSGGAANVNYILPASSPVGSYAIAAAYSGGLTFDTSSEIGHALTITKANAPIVLNGLAQSYDGTPHPVTATTTPSNLAVIFTYNGSTAPPTNPGTYTVSCSIAPSEPNYTGTQTGTLTIQQGAATVQLGNFNQTYDGTPKSVSQSTIPPKLGLSVTYSGSTTLPTNAGNYPVTATVTDANYTGSATGTLTINQAVATITIGNLAQTYDASAKSATIVTAPIPGLPVSVLYNGNPAFPVNAADYAVSATITPPSNYQGISTAVLTINKATATVFLNDSTQVYDGNPKAIGNPSSNPGPFQYNITYSSNTYNSSTTPPANVGVYTALATITGTANYQGSKSAKLTITQATPNVTWNTPSSIHVGTALSNTQLSATTSPVVPGSFKYDPPVGTQLGVGDNQVLTAQFTPADTLNYSTPGPVQVLISVQPPVGATAPTAGSQSYSVNENTDLKVAPPGVLNGAQGNNGISALTAVLYPGAGPAGSLILKFDGSFTYTPVRNFSGIDTFKYQAFDTLLYSTAQTVTITVNFVNQTPSFTLPASAPPVRADAGAQSVAAFATNISAGAPNEDSLPQVLTFTVTADNPSLFATPPAISSTGTLTYTPDPNASGTANVDVTLSDDGANPNGGAAGTPATSAAQHFTITINPAPPVLPSGLSSNGMVGAPFSYQLTASGGKPLTFTAAPLPAGLTFAGDTISGTPAIDGRTPVTVTASNTVPATATQTMNIVVLKTLYATTAAGQIAGAPAGDGAAATKAFLNQPAGVALDKAGNIYIADTVNNRVRKVDAAGIISTVAGGGSQNSDGIQATAAALSGPNAVAADGAGNLYICEKGANRVRKLALAAGLLTSLNLGPNITLSGPSGVAADIAGNVYIADTGNARIVKVDAAQAVTVFAGGGTKAGAAGDGGRAVDVLLNSPFGVAADVAGNVYISDLGDQVLRVVASSGNIKTIAGKYKVQGASGDGGPAAGALLSSPQGVAVDAAGNVFIADGGNHKLREIMSDGTIVTLAGSSGVAGLSGDGKPSFGAALNQPSGVAVADGGAPILVADRLNSRIRRIAPYMAVTFASGPTAAPNPVKVNVPVLFAAAANTAAVSWTWDFGDGSTDTTNTNSPKHTYLAKGTYTVTASATDALNKVATASVPEVVTLSGKAPGVSFTQVPAEIMNLLGLDLEDPAQSPLGLDANGDENPNEKDLAGVKVSSIKLNYSAAGAGKDSMAMTLNVPLPTGAKLDGQQLVLDVGGIAKLFSIKASGKTFVATASTNAKNDTMKMKVNGSTMTMTVTLKNGNFVDTLKKINGFGLADNTAPTRHLHMDFYVLMGLMDGYLYHLNVPIDYKVNVKAQSGSGKS